MMLHEIAFAGSMAIVTVLFFLIIYVGSIVAPAPFRFFRNAQFLGADVDRITPGKLSFGALAGTVLTLFATSWIIGFLWAWLYNLMAG